MTGPRPVPSPAEPCIVGLALWFVMVVAAGTGIFLLGAAVASRIWPVKP